AGSDLAGVRTRAELASDGSGDWIVNGQKIWTSFAQHADWAILLARTDPSLPKHKGLTFFFVDMKSSGIEARPIRQMSGGSDFNEVFLTDVRIPDAQRLGRVGNGWTVALTTLMNERAVGTSMFPSLFSEMYALARDSDYLGQPALSHHAVRGALADWFVKSNGLKFAEYRMITAEAKGRPPGPEASITKLVTGRARQSMSSLLLDLQGGLGALQEPDMTPQNGRFQHLYLRSAGNRIEAGTDEVLRNIIAERILGLPGDMRHDKSMPFRDIPA
ncbi:MAG: acyl-CoA dehydrogenase family protein, partial [Pseudomonadota bacterium]